MKQITIRGVTEDLSRALQQEKKRRGTSLNQVMLDLLRQSLGLKAGQYDNGLSKLADTWTKGDLADVQKHANIFEQIDPEVWA